MRRSFILLLFCLFLCSCSSIKPTTDIKQELNALKQELDATKIKLDKVEENQKNLKEIILKIEEEAIIYNIESGQKTNYENKAAAKQNNAYTAPILLYKKGRSLLLKEKFEPAIKTFTQFLEKYPHNDLADNAMYWIGECYYAATDFENAIKTFKQVVEKYPRGMKVPDALLKTAYSYFSLKDTARARHYLKLVVEKYPFSEASEKAQIKLKTFQ